MLTLASPRPLGAQRRTPALWLRTSPAQPIPPVPLILFGSPTAAKPSRRRVRIPCTPRPDAT